MRRVFSDCSLRFMEKAAAAANGRGVELLIGAFDEY